MPEAPTQGRIDTSTSQTQAKSMKKLQTAARSAAARSIMASAVTLVAASLTSVPAAFAAPTASAAAEVNQPQRILRGAQLRSRSGCVPGRTFQPRHGCGRARTTGHRERTNRCHLPRFYRNSERYFRNPKLGTGSGGWSGSGIQVKHWRRAAPPGLPPAAPSVWMSPRTSRTLTG